MSKRKSKKDYYEEIKRFCVENDIRLIDKEYTNARTKMKFICGCGERVEKIPGQIRIAPRCVDCSNQLRVKGLLKHTESKKYTIEDVHALCKELSVTCKTSNINSVKDNLTLICTSCGEDFERRFENLMLRRKTVCRECGLAKGHRKQSHTIDHVRDFVNSESDCTLLSNEYSNTDSPLEFVCGCGESYKTTFYKFKERNKRQCNKCGQEILTYKNLTTIADVIKMVEEADYTFIDRIHSTVDGVHDIEVICNNNHKYRTRYQNFRNGVRCSECSSSIGERRVTEVLNKHKQEFQPEYIYSDLRGTGGGHLRFDFAVFDKSGNVRFLIEFDGKQHFEPVEIMGGDAYYKKIKTHDNLKDEYCIKNEIALIRIPYWDLNKVENILKEHIAKKGDNEMK